MCGTSKPLGEEKSAKYFGRKNQFEEAAETRKVAKGHCAARKAARKITPRAVAFGHFFHPAVRGSIISSSKAGTIISSRNSMGTICVIRRYTAPKFSLTGHSGK